MIKEIMNAVTIPVMAKVRIGHFVEAQVGDHFTSYYKHARTTLRSFKLLALIILMSLKY